MFKEEWVNDLIGNGVWIYKPREIDYHRVHGEEEEKTNFDFKIEFPEVNFEEIDWKNFLSNVESWVSSRVLRKNCQNFTQEEILF